MRLPPSKWCHGAPTISNHMSAYAQMDWNLRHHWERRRRFIAAMPKKLTCQECGGSGGEVVPVTDDGQGPFESCGFCEGEGLVTPHERAFWLRWKREEKQNAREDSLSRATNPTLMNL